MSYGSGDLSGHEVHGLKSEWALLCRCSAVMASGQARVHSAPDPRMSVADICNALTEACLLMCLRFLGL